MDVNPYRQMLAGEDTGLRWMVLYDSQGNELCREPFTAKVVLTLPKYTTLSHIAYIGVNEVVLAESRMCGVFGPGDTFTFVFHDYPQWVKVSQAEESDL